MSNPESKTVQLKVGESNEFQRLLQQPHRASLETYVNASPDAVKAIESMGRWIAKCGMFGCTREEQGMIIVIACIEMGIGLVEFAQTFDIMHNGKLRKKALAAQVQFEDLGGKVRWIDIGDAASGKAEAELEFNGVKRVFKFTMEDAKAAKIVKKDGAWEAWQSEMLCARALSRGIARMCPRVYAGFESDDESVQALVLPQQETVIPKAEPVKQPEPVKLPVVATAPGPALHGQPTTVLATVEATPAAPAPAAEEKAEAAAGLAPDPNGFRISEELANQLIEVLKDHIPAAVDYFLKLGKITKEQAASGDAFRYVPEPVVKDILSSQKRLELFIKYATKK